MEAKSIKETLELLKLLEKLTAELVKAKSDDGKISYLEGASLALSNAGAAIDAVMGVDKIGDELKNLDAAEAKQIAESVVATVKNIMALVSGK